MMSVNPSQVRPYTTHFCICFSTRALCLWVFMAILQSAWLRYLPLKFRRVNIANNFENFCSPLNGGTNMCTLDMTPGHQPYCHIPNADTGKYLRHKPPKSSNAFSFFSAGIRIANQSSPLYLTKVLDLEREMRARSS